MAVPVCPADALVPVIVQVFFPCAVLIQRGCISVPAVMHVCYPASVSFRECDTAVFVIILKVHRAAVRELLVCHPEQAVVSVPYGRDISCIYCLRYPSVVSVAVCVHCS